MVQQLAERRVHGVDERGRPNADGEHGVVLASRKIGGAVVRNRAKRRLREIFRRETPDAMRPTIDLVAIARRELPRAPFADVEADLRHTLRRLRSAIR